MERAFITDLRKVTIGEFVAQDYRKADVFKRFGLDFCCGGKKPLEVACQEKGIDVSQVEAELFSVDNTSRKANHDFNSWDLPFLIDYIINLHHKYVRENLPLLYEYTHKVANRHGANHPEVVAVADHFAKVAAELTSHMFKEEHILFPFVKQMVAAKNNGERIALAQFGTVENPIRMMEQEHEAAGNELEGIRKITDGYTLPEGACATFTVCYAKLQEFEDDLHTHIHLENNILFPKAVKLEREVVK